MTIVEKLWIMIISLPFPLQLVQVCLSLYVYFPFIIESNCDLIVLTWLEIHFLIHLLLSKLSDNFVFLLFILSIIYI